MRWFLPALFIAGVGLVFAIIHQPKWQAWQALIVREEATPHANRTGQFDDMGRLKQTQEMILELARNPSVVTAALKQVEPPASCRDPGRWPSPEDVEAARDNIAVVPPGGAEFGTTEVFYLTVTDVDRHRAIRIAELVCDQLERRFNQLRDRKATSLIAELTKTVQLSRDELGKATTHLAELEATVGSDLAALRMLNESVAGETSLQTTAAQIRQELRQAEAAQQSQQHLLGLLTAAQEDPASLVATPNELLESQPALRRLKEGLIDAQLNTSRNVSTMSVHHPRVIAAQVAEDEVRGHLHRELALAVRGLQAGQAMAESRVRALSEKLADVDQRLLRLAAMRAEYGNQVAEVRQHAQTLTESQRELTAARASLAAANSASLITRVDDPQTGPHPLGPRRSLIAGAGVLGGLLVGLGLLFLTVVPAEIEVAPERPEPRPEERPPALHRGRRSSDPKPVRSMTLKQALAELHELA